MVYFRYLISIMIWRLINPFAYYQSIMQLIGQVNSILRSLTHEEPKNIPLMSLPFEGEWMVFNGGTEKATSHSWNLIAQRYAYDFVCPGIERNRFRTDGKTPADYLAFNQNVNAAADGVVVEVQNDLRDARATGSGWIDIRTRDIRGNYIVIKHDEGVFSLTAHLENHSCTVKRGDKVKRGQIIAKCGNSGHSTEPHIHFQIQDKANFYFARGFPIPFGGIVVRNHDTKTVNTERGGYISKKDLVSNAAANDGSFGEVTVDYPISNDWPSQLLRSTVTLVGLTAAYVYIIFTIVGRLLTLGLRGIGK